MKKSVFFGFFILILYQSAFSIKLEITPLIINFNGVIAKEKTIIAYGDYGSILISHDNAANWVQTRIFSRGSIINFFFENNNMIAFNNIGDIAISYDQGIKWQTITNLPDTILAVIKYPEGYFLRARKKIFALTEDFKIKSEFPLLSKILTTEHLVNKSKYMKSLTYYKNNLIVEIDSSNFIRFDNKLNPLDTLSFSKLGVFDSTYRYLSGYMINADSNYLYLKVVAVKKSNPHTAGYYVTDIYRTKDFKAVEKFDSLASTFSIYKIINNKYYYLNLNRNSKYLKDSTKITDNYYFLYFTDFTLNNNEFVIVGERKILETLNLKDSSLSVISDFIRYSPILLPNKIDDSNFIFYSGDYQQYYPYIYRTNDNGITFKPIVENKYDSIYENRFSTYKFRFKYFDKKSREILFGGNQMNYGDTYIFRSYDYCKSFKQKKIVNYFRFGNLLSTFYLNAYHSINIQKRNDNFITSDGPQPNLNGNNEIYTSLYTFDKDFNVISILTDSNIVVDYVFSKDTNNYLIHCANAIDSTSELRYSSDKGKNWKIIHKYPISLTHSYSKEIEINNKKYLALIHYDITNYPIFSGGYFDIVDLENYKFKRICEWKPPSNATADFGIYGISIDSDSNLVYIAFQDTLFYTNDIFNKSKWQYYIIPNNGRIIRPFKKFGNRYFARYTDNDIPWGNALFWIKIKDTTTSVVDNQIEKHNYLYSYPPYPMPARDQVKTLIYWDTSIDIDKDRIKIVDIFGNKFGDKKDITINKQSPYSGVLTWNCSDIPNGIYFILITHGTEKRAIKILVNK